ncbi:MAG: DNA-binding NarL/FixJ family response regulator [Alphaproteobacteria bacterium]|jgi:DNA-binding NarL/FixJ family response regulator
MTHNILVVDDHVLIREGIVSLLDKEQFSVIGEASDGKEAITQYDELSPEIVLMDMQMPEMSGLDASKAILEKHPDAKIVMLSVDLTEAELMRAVDLSIKGYLLKTSNSDALNHALSLVMAGESVFPSEALMRGMNSRHQTQEMGLTPREEEILRHIAHGESNKGIARNLGVTEGTIKVHIKAILKKLDMNNRTQAAIYAHERGLV